MKYFYDFEFLEDGKTIDPISVGIVCEDGREYYAVNGDFNYNLLERDDWMMENVVPYLPLRRQPVKHGPSNWSFAIDEDDKAVRSRARIANEIRTFITEDNRDDVHLWGDYCAFDHVLLAWLYGKMIDLPPNIPMHTNEFQTIWESKGKPQLPERTGTNHHALEDALYVKTCYEAIA